MKKLMLLLMCSVFLMTACSKKTEPHPLVFFNLPFECDSIIKYNSNEYKVHISAKTKDDITLAFKEPMRLDEIELKYSKGDVTLNYNGLNLSLGKDKYISENSMLLIRNIFYIPEKSYIGAEIIKQGGVKYCVEQYAFDNSVIKLYFEDNKETPSMIDADINGNRFSITFVNNN